MEPLIKWYRRKIADENEIDDNEIEYEYEYEETEESERKQL